MIDYSIDQFFDDFPDFKSQKNKENIFVGFDDRSQLYTVNGYKFTTIEELIMHIELTYENDADIWVDAGEFTDTILKMWYEHQTTATSSDSSSSSVSPSN